MGATISNNVQALWKDCYASSAQVKLTLRTNGEEKTQVITPRAALVQAGFVAPTAAPTLVVSSGGTLDASKYYAYAYVYASSQYPFVENAVTGNGDVWPRSNPSPSASAVTTGSNKTITVTVTKTTRSDVDWVWVYRTISFSTQALADADAAAGNLFYIGRVGNDGIAGTTTLTDNGLVDTGEKIETDNYVAPTAQFCVFDGTYWWTGGNWEFVALVTLDGTTTVVLNSGTWFNGRDAQTATFDGVTNGGFDNKGTFYIKITGATTATLYNDPLLTGTLAVRATGTTKIHIQGPASTLYRSKPRNPFSWGITNTQITDTGTQDEPEEFARKFGGGFFTALAVLPNERLLKIDAEQPARCFTLNLAAADSDSFSETQDTIDDQYSVGSHFSQIRATSKDASSLMGIDAKNFSILQMDGQSQGPNSDEVFRTMRALMDDNKEQRFWHGVYDPTTELYCFWVKKYDLGGNKCDTLLALHKPTGFWTTEFDAEISASAMIYDPVTDENIVLVGTEDGRVGRAFDTSDHSGLKQLSNWDTIPYSQTNSPYVAVAAANATNLSYTAVADVGGSLNGTGFVLTIPTGTFAIVIEINNAGVSSTVSTVSSVDATTNTITFTSPHGFSTADAVFVSNDNDDLPPATPQILADHKYFVRNTGASTVKLYTTAADASADTNAIDFLSASFSGTFLVSKLPSWASAADLAFKAYNQGIPSIVLPLNASAAAITDALTTEITTVNAAIAGVVIHFGDGFAYASNAGITTFFDLSVTDQGSGFTFTSYPSLFQSNQSYFAAANTWGLIVLSTGVPAYWYKTGWVSGGIVSVSKWLTYGGTTYFTTAPTVPIGSLAFNSIVHTTALRYTDAGTPTKGKTQNEIFATVQYPHPWQLSLADDYQLWVAWYKDFSATASNTHKMQRDKTSGSSTRDSATFFNKTQTPSALTNQFGFRITEYGYKEFQLLNVTLKANATT